MKLWGSGVLKVLQLVFNLLLLLLILLWRLTSIICCLIQLSHHTKLAGRCWMELLKGHFPDQGSRRDKDLNQSDTEDCWCHLRAAKGRRRFSSVMCGGWCKCWKVCRSRWLEWQRCWVKTTLTVGVFLNMCVQGFFKHYKKGKCGKHHLRSFILNSLKMCSGQSFCLFTPPLLGALLSVAVVTGLSVFWCSGNEIN